MPEMSLMSISQPDRPRIRATSAHTSRVGTLGLAPASAGGGARPADATCPRRTDLDGLRQDGAVWLPLARHGDGLVVGEIGGRSDHLLRNGDRGSERDL